MSEFVCIFINVSPCIYLFICPILNMWAMFSYQHTFRRGSKVTSIGNENPLFYMCNKRGLRLSIYVYILLAFYPY